MCHDMSQSTWFFHFFGHFFAIFRNLLHTSSFSRPYIWRLLQIQHRFPNFSDFPHIWTIIYGHNWCKIKENWRCTQYPRFLAASHTGCPRLSLEISRFPDSVWKQMNAPIVLWLLVVVQVYDLPEKSAGFTVGVIRKENCAMKTRIALCEIRMII